MCIWHPSSFVVKFNHKLTYKSNQNHMTPNTSNNIMLRVWTIGKQQPLLLWFATSTCRTKLQLLTMLNYNIFLLWWIPHVYFYYLMRFWGPLRMHSVQTELQNRILSICWSCSSNYLEFASMPFLAIAANALKIRLNLINTTISIGQVLVHYFSGCSVRVK